MQDKRAEYTLSCCEPSCCPDVVGCCHADRLKTVSESYRAWACHLTPSAPIPVKHQGVVVVVALAAYCPHIIWPGCGHPVEHAVVHCRYRCLAPLCAVPVQYDGLFSRL